MLTGGTVQNYRNFGGGACGAEYFCCIFAFFQSLQSHTFLFGHCASTYKHWVKEGSVHSHSQKWPFFMCQWTNLPKLCGIKTVVEMQTTTGWKNCVVLWNVVPGPQSSRRFWVKTWLWSGKTDIFWFSSVHKYTTELLLFQQFVWVFFSTFSIRQNIIPPDICLNGLMMCKAFFFYREPYLRGSLPGTFGLTVLNCTRL